MSSIKAAPLRYVASKAVDESLQRIGRHPFIERARTRALTREQAHRWIMCAGRESRSFPSILENMLTRCENTIVRDVLTENLNDEHGNGNPEEAHFRHYLHLLDKLGMPREKFYNYHEREGIKLALSLAYNVSKQESEAVAIGYMLVNEGMTQTIYSSVQIALQPYYPDLQTRFFDLHVEVDERHLESLYTAVDQIDQSREAEVLLGISVGERGMAVLLDEAYGLFDYCTAIPKYETVH